jgi:NADH-quinone oxidoreductase subunit H
MNWLNILILIIQCLVIAIAVTTGFAYLTLFERRLLARLQNRIGPNRAGPGGFLQPGADAVKLFFKEDIIPAMADKAVYLLAPALAVIPAIIIWAVIPLGCFNINWDHTACFDLSKTSQLNNILQIADVNVGVLYLLAVTSIGVYGITLAGWASSNKYSMMGGIRSSAQLISYELALGLAVLGAVMQAGTMSTHEIVVGQSTLWAIVPQLLGFFIFLIASTAEVVRAPFDLVEAEQELAGGYNTEYGSMKFALFFMAEYIKLIAVSAIAAMLYLGGWGFPGLQQLGDGLVPLTGPVFASIAVGLVSLGAFLLKVLFFLFLSVWVRASWPRMRYDRLMDFGWKWLLPLALANIVLTAVVNVLVDNPLLQGAIMCGAAIIFVIIALNSTRPIQATSGIKLVKAERSGD